MTLTIMVFGFIIERKKRSRAHEIVSIDLASRRLHAPDIGVSIPLEEIRTLRLVSQGWRTSGRDQILGAIWQLVAVGPADAPSPRAIWCNAQAVSARAPGSLKHSLNALASAAGLRYEHIHLDDRAVLDHAEFSRLWPSVRAQLSWRCSESAEV